MPPPLAASLSTSQPSWQPPHKGVLVADIIDITGVANLGYNAVFAFSTASTYNMRLYNGITEIADGAVTQTVKAIAWLAGGSLQ